MAKTKPKPPKKKVKPIPPLRAWEVALAGGGDVETVLAHDCSTYNDSLSFTRIESVDAEGDREWVTVRAFADPEWKSVRLVEETPPVRRAAGRVVTQ
jgi:hypothetical protein